RSSDREPGRALVGAAAVTVYEVGVIKDVTTGDSATPQRRYVAVDGGMSDNIRLALYGAEYDARIINRYTDGEEIPSRVVVSHCESGDIVIDNIVLPDDVKAWDV